MSTAQQVRDAWNTNVFLDASVQAVTTQIYDREMVKDISGDLTAFSQKALLLFGNEYNWIEYPTVKYDDGGLIGQRRFFYRVNVIYYRQTDPDGSNYVASMDLMNTIQGLADSALGVTWGGTVDKALPISGQPQINTVSIKGVRLVRVQREFLAEKYI